MQDRTTRLMFLQDPKTGKFAPLGSVQVAPCFIQISVCFGK